MAFSIGEFTAEINKRGLAKNNLFFAYIVLNGENVIPLNSRISGRELTFFAKSVSIPEISLNTIDVRNYGIGPAEKRPIGVEYSPLMVQFMVDSKYDVQKFFHNWLQVIYNRNTEDGVMAEDPAGKGLYELEYPNNYFATIVIVEYPFNQTSDPYIHYFEKAFPNNVGATELSWENQAEIKVMPISFSYSHYRTNADIRGTVTSGAGVGLGLIEYVSYLNSVVQTIRQVERPNELQKVIDQFSSIKSIAKNF